MSQPEVKRLMGMMNLDDPQEVVADGQHTDAWELRFKGQQGNKEPINVQGTTLIPNPFLFNTGTNLCIGRHYDENKGRLFLFIYNSSGQGAIYIYNVFLGTWNQLIQDGVNTGGVNILNFLPTVTIQGMYIIYDVVNGDLLYFLDSQKVPRKVNIQRLINGGYPTILYNYTVVIKAPPTSAPKGSYEHDYTVNANNLQNSLYQFAQTFIYDDFEESVYSPVSRVYLPTKEFSNVTSLPPSQNARIRLFLQTGDINILKIKLYMRQTNNGTTTDWQLVETIVKTTPLVTIPSNSYYQYLFYNNGNYIVADTNLSNLLYDNVPINAGCMTGLNGNSLVYANVTQGYNYFQGNFSYNLNNIIPTTVPGAFFNVVFNGQTNAGQPVVAVYLTGAGQNDSNGNPITLDYPPQVFNVKAKSGTSQIGFTYTNISSNSIPTILSALQSAAVTAGWTILVTGTNSFTMYYPTGTITLQVSYINSTNTVSIIPPVVFTLYPDSGYSYGIVYRDQYGRTNGVITDVSANVYTQPYNSNAYGATITLNLNGITPPMWATTYAIVRSNTETYIKTFYWVSNQAFSNVGVAVQNQYAFIGITNIADYNNEIQASQGVVSYDFSQGDRIRFYIRFDANTNIFPIYHDYPVLGLITDPVVNGVQQIGNFIKIAYPTADIAADPNFKFDGTPNFQNYAIFIYNVGTNTTGSTTVETAAQNASTTALAGNIYYEIGETHGIGNAGTAQAYHHGNLNDNTLCVFEGDAFLRTRTVPAGNTYYVTVTPEAFSNTYVVQPIPDPAVATGLYTLGPQPSGAASLAANVFPTISTFGGMFQNTTAATRTIRLRGTFTATVDGSPTYITVNAKICTSPTTATIVPLVIQNSTTPILPNATSPQVLSFDATFAVPGGAKVWFITGNGLNIVNLHVQPIQIRIDVLNNLAINIYDPSYSDVYNIKTNSDSKPNLQNPAARQTTYPAQYVWGQAYQLDTSLNNTNRFYPTDIDELLQEYGPIQRMSTFGKNLRFFQFRKCSVTGVFQQFIKSNEGQPQLIKSDTIITPNNAQYYEGDYGIGNQVDSLVTNEFVDYFCDDITSKLVRLSLDGLIPISTLYKVQSLIGPLVSQYFNNFNYQFGGFSRVLGTWHTYKDTVPEYISTFQGGTGPFGTINGFSLSFDESANAFTSKFAFAPDAIIGITTDLYTVYNGNLYIHNNTTNYNTYYGVQSNPRIQLVFNKNVSVTKKFLSLGYQANQLWQALAVGDIKTSFLNPQTGFQQISQLINGAGSTPDIEVFEGKYVASLLRDANSKSNAQLALFEGDYLLGAWISLLLTYVGSGRAFLYEPYITWITSGRNF